MTVKDTGIVIGVIPVPLISTAALYLPASSPSLGFTVKVAVPFASILFILNSTLSVLL